MKYKHKFTQKPNNKVFHIRDKTMASKLMFIPNDELQNYIFFRLQLVVETFEHSI